MREVFQKRNVRAYVYIVEAWFRIMSDKKDADRAWQKGLSQDPERQEALVFMCEDATGCLMARRDITRKAKGKPSLGPLRFEESTHTEGRFSHLLPAQRRTH